jgi:EAL and modified HD-GYP domain-containing signal transduction protein
MWSMAILVPRDTTEASPVLASRQPVLDARDRVVGYRVSWSVLSGGLPVAPAGAEAITVVNDVLSLIDHDEQLLGNKAHLSVSREMLLSGQISQIRPERMLLRIRYEDAVSPPLIPTIFEAAHRGFELELDGLPGPDVDLRLLDNFSTVEIDLARWNVDDVGGVLTRMRGFEAHGLAASVNNHTERDAARRLGFQWFSGPFFATPNMGGAPIPASDLQTIVELYRVQRSHAPLDKLIAVIEHEPGLGARLLKSMNSAYFGFSGRTGSTAQAAAMLGTRGLSRWALIVASLSASKPIPRELAMLTLTRARACELVGLDDHIQLDSDQLFTIGMLSTCDAVFGMPMEQVIQELPLADEVAGALLHRSGPGGKILKSVIAYGNGDFLSPALRSALHTNSAAYREALDWARRAIYGIS